MKRTLLFAALLATAPMANAITVIVARPAVIVPVARPVTVAPASRPSVTPATARTAEPVTRPVTPVVTPVIIPVAQPTSCASYRERRDNRDCGI